MTKLRENNTLKTLKRETEAWKRHVERLRLNDRTRFVEWLSTVLTARELALIIDSELGRRALWEVYLREHYGP
ncbi:MAG: hypothetical protein C4532_10835 [Candidatus Abyssobacteria bacterium SURF_17]|uniref:Uncharacterized protein n=1 Tax=Candidatus Abyssobacteria bacterium SURF_17 TaxID=2093361 RepID=A0A419EXJ6_9BACT|nr:MAG: hypothetical protein C4532_10835 [Candidatus Abyssubacteria bacterium SURF_17]